MTEAFLWGALAASSLMIGGVLALAFRVSGRLLGLVAYLRGGKAVGLVPTFGFAVAFGVSALS